MRRLPPARTSAGPPLSPPPPDALQCGAAWWRVEPHAQPVLVDTVDAVGHARQPVVGAEHPVAAVADLAASKQQQLAFEWVAWTCPGFPDASYLLGSLLLPV